MHYALALLPATHLPTVSLHTQTRPRHTHTHTHTHMGLVQLAGFLFLTLFSQIVHVHECTHLCVRACTYTHTHTDWACTTCSDIGSYFSHCLYKACMCMNCTRLCTHTWTHTHTHTLTQTGLVPLAVTLVLISHTVFTKHACA